MARIAQNDLRITDQFDLEAFWTKHGKKIIIAVLALVAFGGILLFRQNQANQRVEQAAATLAMARDPASLEQVARDFAGTQTALEALSRLGDIQYHEGKYSEATSTYERILKDFASNPLSESARLGLAAVREAQGNFDAAKGFYSRIVESSPTSFIGSAARMGMARCLEMLGQPKEARQVYEEIMAAAQGSPWHQMAYLRWMVLGRELPASLPSAPEGTRSDQLSTKPSFPLSESPSGSK